MISKIPGDYIDLSLFNYIITQCKKHLENYHFTEIVTPIIEPTGLYKLDDTTLCRLATDGEKPLCLRPKIQPSIARAYSEHGIIQTPWKVYTCGPIFRFAPLDQDNCQERHQINAHIMGTSSLSYDVQLITMFDRFFSHTLSLNSYALTINFLGCQTDRTEYTKKLKAFLESSKAHGICDTCKKYKEKNSMQIFSCTNEQCQTIYRIAPRILDHLCKICAHEWTQIQEQLDLLSVTYIWNPALIQHVDHYDKTVFEFSSPQLEKQNCFCSGGRQDSNDKSSVNAALDIERLIILLEPYKATLALPQAPALTVILPRGIEQQILALLIADNLRAHGLCIDIVLETDTLENMLRKANKMGASYCLILGHEEQQARIVTIKNMITGAENKIEQSNVYEYLTR